MGDEFGRVWYLTEPFKTAVSWIRNTKVRQRVASPRIGEVVHVLIFLCQVTFVRIKVFNWDLLRATCSEIP